MAGPAVKDLDGLGARIGLVATVVGNIVGQLVKQRVQHLPRQDKTRQGKTRKRVTGDR